MNPFRSRKKAAKDGPPPIPSDDRPAPPSGKSFRRGKKKQPEPKPELDLVHALPSSDDFRTSLLMPTFSARFSMFREQDDPTSKLGKASDDSVLFPNKRSSRFGGGLADIAEVSSIHGSIRPPFAQTRADSYGSGDGYGTDDDSSHNGSVMSRSRPGEGNSLFGGRQKIYKIPAVGATSTKTLGATGGKPIYENDVQMSAFQRKRERDRELAAAAAARELEEANEEEPRGSFNLQSRNRVPSPPLVGYNRNRETSSSTNSGPSNGRTSTAATSVTSQNATPDLERSVTKSRRLYDQGLDQHLYDQQSSAMHRLDQLTRLRQVGANSPVHNGPNLSHARSAGNLSDRYERSGIPRSATSNLPLASPPPSMPPPIPGAFRQESRSNGSPHPGLPQSPPLSPLNDDEPEARVLPAAIRPEDRGKATAMGAFNMPKRPYDDRQYSQRQLQLQQGRETPPPTRGISPASVENMTQSKPMPQRTSPNQRPAQSDMQPVRLSEESVPEAPEESFLAAPSGSDMSATEESDVEGYSQRPGQARRMGFGLPPAPQVSVNSPPRDGGSPVSDYQGSSDSHHNLEPQVKVNAADSPTLGPAPGLSGMIRQHLRTDSDKSSIYAPVSPITTQFPTSQPRPIQSGPETKGSPAKSPPNHDPRAYRQWKRNKQGNQGTFANRNFALENEPTLTGYEEFGSSPYPDGEDGTSHTRDASTETQHFANELAQRRKMVQENLKSFAEAESRSTSPGPGNSRNESPIKTGGAFSMLKPRSPNPGASAKPEGSSKALKMLGLGNGENRAYSPQRGPTHEEIWREEEDRMLRTFAKTNKAAPPRLKTLQQSERDALREQEQRNQANGGYANSKGSSTPSSSRATSQASTRDRSESDASIGQGGRSMSRNARYREEMDGQSTPVNYGPTAEHVSRPRQHSNSPRMGTEYQQPAFESPAGRARSNSKVTSPTIPLYDPRPHQAAHRPPPVTVPQQSQYEIPAWSPSSATPNGVHSREGVQSGPSTHRKRSVNKSDISEPTFVSCTSNITTVSLPQNGANVSSNNVAPPPVPPINPRRRRGVGNNAQTVVGTLGRGGERSISPALPMNPPYASPDMGAYSADENEAKKAWQPRHQLRKSNSEGGNLNMMARKQAQAAEDRAISPAGLDGGMF